MRENLNVTKGLIVAEAVMMGFAPRLRRQQAHDKVYAACREALALGRSLYDVLAADSAVAKALDDERLRALSDPINYLGSAPAMVDLVVSKRSKE